MPTLRIAAFSMADAPGLVPLLREMQAHYRAPCPPDDEILADLRTLPAGVTLLLAHAPHVVGIASLTNIYPGPGLRRGLFLKDLYVASERRRAGVGLALMRAAARLAVDTGCNRLDWTADRDDASLLGFYRALGARETPEKLFMRLSADALREAARRDAH